jgi:hypothetical protein
MKRLTFSCAVLALLALTLPLTVHAKPTPVPGGANQAAGVQSTYPATVFNGFVRIKPKYFGPPRPQDTITETPVDGQQILVFSGTISDGRSQAYLDDPTIQLADADGVTADTRSIEPNGIILQTQASAARLYVVFWAPKDFVPDHILFTCNSTKCKPIRIKFKH